MQYLYYNIFLTNVHIRLHFQLIDIPTLLYFYKVYLSLRPQRQQCRFPESYAEHVAINNMSQWPSKLHTNGFSVTFVHILPNDGVFHSHTSTHAHTRSHMHTTNSLVLTFISVFGFI